MITSTEPKACARCGEVKVVMRYVEGRGWLCVWCRSVVKMERERLNRPAPWWQVDHAKGFRWYTVKWWRHAKGYGLDAGVKMGPVTLYAYDWDGVREFGVSVLGRWSVDSGIIRRGGQWFIR